MKKFSLILFCLCLCFCVSCSKNKTQEPMASEQAYSSTLDKKVAYEIENISENSSLDDETIKALSVVVRTNLLNQKSDNNIINEYSPQNERIIKLVNETSGEVLAKENNTNEMEEILIETNESENHWVKEIRKIDVLKFLNRKNIKVSNISKINNKTNKFGNTEKLEIGGKQIDFKEVMNEFDLPSNKIESINNNISTITVSGIGEGNENNFNIFEAQKEAETGKDYKNILKYRYNSFKIIIK